MSVHFVNILELMFEIGCRLIRIRNCCLDCTDCISWIFLEFICGSME